LNAKYPGVEMTGWRKIFIGFLMVVCAGTLAAQNVVTSPVRVTGRSGITNGNPILYWGCASVDARFEGTSLGVKLRDQSGNNYYQVIIDDGEPVRFKAATGIRTNMVASNLTAGVHQVQLFRLTEGDLGWTEFHGFVLDAGKTLQTPPAAPELKIEFYGDSITTGLGNEATDITNDLKRVFQNNYLAYSAITARNLGAEIHCIAQQGIGVFVGWMSPMDMTNIWNRLTPKTNATLWAFSNWTPNVVVVNLLANDKARLETLTPIPTEAQIVQYYVNFVSSIRAVYPNAHIVCALGGMDATAEGSPWPGYIHQAVVQMADGNMSECIFPYIGVAGHPRVVHHQAMAEQLTAHIRSVLYPPGFLFQIR
jgi:hypothetical protein